MLAKSLDLCIDFEFSGNKGTEEFVDLIQREHVACPVIMAYGCHGLNPLSDADDRKAFISHVTEAAHYARLTGSGAVLTAVYERRRQPRFEHIASEIYHDISVTLPATRILIEALSGERSVFLPSAPRMCAFVARMGTPRIGVAVDTWHLFNSSHALERTLDRYAHHFSIVHLKDSDSLLPGLGSLDFDAIMRHLKKGGFKGTFTIECRRPRSVAVFERSVRNTRRMIQEYFPV